MKNKLVAVIVALGGFACLAAIPISSAQAATSPTKSTPTSICPAGTTVLTYCTEKCPTGTSLVSNYCETCPSGDLVADYCEICPRGTSLQNGYCETASGKIVAAGPPTLFDWVLWGSGKRYGHGPALKFHVKKGIDGAPDLKSLTCSLPSGLTFASSASKNPSTLTLSLGRGVSSVLVYLKNHSMVESSTLRHEIIAGTVKKLTFDISVTDTAGKTTKLAFSVNAAD